MHPLSAYHITMRNRAHFSLILALIAVPSLLLTISVAQINGVPSSVTSPGFGGRPVNGTAPSVSSLGPRGFTPNTQARFSTPVHTSHNGNGTHHHHRQSNYSAPLLYAYPYPVPYAADEGPADYTEEPENDANYQGGPTVFDRRGSGESSYIPPVNDMPAAHNSVSDGSAESAPVPVDPTLLVYKDGRKVEVGNYAIVGTTLFDLTPGHPRKIALVELDLDATRKQNDDRGVVFQLPPSLRTK